MATLISADIDEIQALLQLVQRAPMTRAEALFTEMLFSRWLDQLAQPGGAGGTSAADAPPADQHIGQPSQPLPASQPSTKPGDQV